MLRRQSLQIALATKLKPERPKVQILHLKKSTAFTKKVTGFYKDTQFWDWVYRGSHGLDKSYDSEMFHYRLWWQSVGMVKHGDVVEFKHQYKGTSENMTDRSVKVMVNAIALYLLTNDQRIGEIAAGMMRGIVAQS